MAIDVYLQIEGIKGESADAKHQGWIECESVSWGVSQPRSATASTGGGHTAERCEHDDIIIHKTADVATPLLLQYCSSGKTHPRAKIEFFRADGHGVRVKYFEIVMENVLISRVAPAVGGGDMLSERVHLKYSVVRWQYTQQLVAGGAGGNTTGGWNLSSNRLV